jgi:hypothetical protein
LGSLKQLENTTKLPVPSKQTEGKLLHKVKFMIMEMEGYDTLLGNDWLVHTGACIPSRNPVYVPRRNNARGH